ncbi:peptidoglycan-binding domain-containing protein [Listeria monocytogenes]|nr:peptidoglycan-binding domain-containing protein [Listeria monocytogenes]
MRANTIELAADFCQRHGIDPATHMIRHYDVTGKDCPHFYVVDPAGWAQFKAEVIAKVKGVKVDTVVVNVGSEDNGNKTLQANLNKLGYDCGTVDGIIGAKTKAAIKALQKATGLDVDGIAGPKTLAKIAELLAPKKEEPKVETPAVEAAPVAETKPVEPAKPMPKVTSLGDKYSVQVKAKVATGVYKNADVSEKTKTLKAGTVFSVYGYATAAWAVPGGFVQMKDVEPVAVTLKTGGLNPTMEADFRTFLKSIGLDGALNLAKGGNPSGTITASGLDLVKVKRFLDDKGWYYKEAK